jgi:hypothetical protein
MENDLSEHQDTRYEYQAIDEYLKKSIDEEYSNQEQHAQSILDSTIKKEGITLEELLQGILLTGENLIPDFDPLSVSKYTVSPASDPYNPQKYLDSGQDLQMHLTNKRLLLVRSGRNSHPFLEKTGANGYKVGCTKGDSYSCLPLSLSNIYGYSLSMDREVSSEAIVKRKAGGGIFLLFGFLILIAGIVTGVINGFQDTTWIVVSAVLILAGLGLIIFGLLRRGVDISDSQQTIKQGKFLRLLLVDPIYMTKALINIDINKEKHTEKFIIRWVSELQNRCEAIRDAKIFEKRLVI